MRMLCGAIIILAGAILLGSAVIASAGAKSSDLVGWAFFPGIILVLSGPGIFIRSYRDEGEPPRQKVT
jgi:hypothetical protein